MVFNKNKKGQAAIECLMTYGWMLLVVLIVGALIFSFVDFGTLLPNKLELSNNLRGDPAVSIAYSKDTVISGNKNLVKVLFRYNGAKRAMIGIQGAKIDTELDDICYAIHLENLDTHNTVNASNITIATGAYDFETPNTDTAFLNGHDGVITFDCNDNDDGITAMGGNQYNVAASEVHGIPGGIILGDTIVGKITIPVKDPKSSLEIPSTGSIRLQIS